MTVDIEAIKRRISELRDKDEFVRHLQGFAASTADMLEDLVDRIVAGDESRRLLHEANQERSDLLEHVIRLNNEAVRLKAELAHATAHDDDDPTNCPGCSGRGERVHNDGAIHLCTLCCGTGVRP